jgi:hypothetical protein
MVPPSDTDHPSHPSHGIDKSIDYQALFEQVKAQPCKISHMERADEVKGEKLRTRPHLIDRELERVYAASTLEEIHKGDCTPACAKGSLHGTLSKALNLRARPVNMHSCPQCLTLLRRC